MEIHWKIHGNTKKSTEIMKIHGNHWKSMEIHGNPWKSMQSHGDLWNFMEIHGISENLTFWTSKIDGFSGGMAPVGPGRAGPGWAGPGRKCLLTQLQSRFAAIIPNT